MYASPPTSPTSRRRRTSSTASSGQAISVYSPVGRRDSQYSTGSRRSSRIYSGDGSLRNQSSTSINGYFGSSVLGNGGTEQENLADELAGAMDEEDGVDEGAEDATPNQLDGSFSPSPKSPQLSPIKMDPERTRDSGIEVSSIHADKLSGPKSPKHARRPSKSKHSRTHSRKESRVEVRDTKVNSANTQVVEEIPASLQQRITEVERLARLGSNSDNTIEEVEDTVGQFVALLRDLGGQQASLESYSTRLITTHTSLSMHLAHQSRTLQSLTHYLLAPLPAQATFLDGEEDESNLIALLVAATESIPKPTSEALLGLHRLYTSSADLNSCLSSLSDNLHLSRQVTSTATRRLKSAKELVAEMRKELRANEEGIMWIEDGQWEARLQRRECASVCREVVGGFEDICNGWRSKLEQEAATGLHVA